MEANKNVGLLNISWLVSNTEEVAEIIENSYRKCFTTERYKTQMGMFLKEYTNDTCLTIREVKSQKRSFFTCYIQT